FTTAIAHQTAGRDKPAKFVDGRQCMANCQGSQLFAVSSEEVVGSDDERACLQLDQGFKDWTEIALAARVQNMELHPGGVGGRLREARRGLSGVRDCWIYQKSDDRGRGQEFAQQLQSLWRYFYVQTCYASHVAAGPVKVGDKSEADWVATYREDDWNA